MDGSIQLKIMQPESPPSTPLTCSSLYYVLEHYHDICTTNMNEKIRTKTQEWEQNGLYVISFRLFTTFFKLQESCYSCSSYRFLSSCSGIYSSRWLIQVLDAHDVTSESMIPRNAHRTIGSISCALHARHAICHWGQVVLMSITVMYIVWNATMTRTWGGGDDGDVQDRYCHRSICIKDLDVPQV